MRRATIIKNFLHEWVKDGCIAETDLKEISIQLAEKLKPTKQGNPLNKPFTELFDTYGKRYGKIIVYTPRTGRAINEIIDKLTELVKKKNGTFTSEEITGAWELILQNLPEFYKDSYDIIAINNKLDSIINGIKSGRQKSVSPDQVDGYLDTIRKGSNVTG